MSDGAGRLRVDGARRLRADLKAAGTGVQDLKDAHKKVADLVAREAAPDAPVGPPAGGHIKDTIRTSGTASAAIVRAGRARMPYGPAVHWGYRAGHIKAQPWIYRAAQRTSDQWVRIYTDSVQDVLDQVRGTDTP